MNLRKLVGKVFKSDVGEVTIEINKDELEVLKQGANHIIHKVLDDMTKETKSDNMVLLINKYNQTNGILESIKEEEENEYEEITLALPQIDVIVEALYDLEEVTTNNLKMIEDPSNYKTICKTMVTISNLMERLVSLI